MPVLPIQLSHGFIPSVQLHDKVSVGQTIAVHQPIQEITINLTEQLGVHARDVKKYLKKKPGDAFRSKEILAVKKNFFGGIDAEVVSKTAGVITHFDPDSGELTILPEERETPDTELVISPIEGKIALCNNDTILIETEKDFLEGIKGIGGQEIRQIFILEEKETVESYHLQADAIGKIIVGHYFPKDVLMKSVSIGVAAIIGTKIYDGDITYLQDRKLLIPMIEISFEDMKKIKHWQGKNAFVHGAEKTIILLHN